MVIYFLKGHGFWNPRIPLLVWKRFESSSEPSKGVGCRRVSGSSTSPLTRSPGLLVSAAAGVSVHPLTESRSSLLSFPSLYARVFRRHRTATRSMSRRHVGISEDWTGGPSRSPPRALPVPVARPVVLLRSRAGLGTWPSPLTSETRSWRHPAHQLGGRS